MIKAILFGTAALFTVATGAHAATLVNANQSTPTLLGVYGPGTYTITGSGLIDLVGPVGSGFTMRPDGVPDVPVVAPGYGYFNPSGSYLADGAYGPGGTVAKIGALMGTLLATPLVPTDYFLIGYGTSITLLSNQAIYAQVNDTFYPNDGGAFTVNVALAAVPEAATWAMMVAGFAAAGFAMRQRKAIAVHFA